jgi:hypothetical protein
MYKDYLDNPTLEKYMKVENFRDTIPEEDEEKMDKRIKLLTKHHGKPDTEFLMKLRGIQRVDKRAEIWLKKYSLLPEDRKAQLLEQTNVFLGIRSANFIAEINKSLEQGQ